MKTIGVEVGVGVGAAIGGITTAGGLTVGAIGCLVKLENSCEKGVSETTGLGIGVVTGG